MLCSKCTKAPAVKGRRGMCRSCYATDISLRRLDSMEIYLCAGECGKRIHNRQKVVVPGVPQGRGPGMKWCNACVDRFNPEPSAERIVKNRGLCKACKRPMLTGNKDTEGFVRHKAKCLCTGCYNTHNYLVRRGINLGELNRAAKLQEGDVIEIRRLYADGMRQPELAEMYSVSHQNIHSIVTRKSWRHIV